MNDIKAMVDGYFSGRESAAMDLPECYANESAAFKHGWLNGRDDRLRQPRDRYDVLKRRAEMILGEVA